MLELGAPKLKTKVPGENLNTWLIGYFDLNTKGDKGFTQGFTKFFVLLYYSSYTLFQMGNIKVYL